MHHKSFEVVALFVVLLGCGSLMLELPLPLCVTADCVTGLCAIQVGFTAATLSRVTNQILLLYILQPVLVYVDLAITVFFTIEIVLKVCFVYTSLVINFFEVAITINAVPFA